MWIVIYSLYLPASGVLTSHSWQNQHRALPKPDVALRGWGGRIASSLQTRQSKTLAQTKQKRITQNIFLSSPIFLPDNRHLSACGFSLSLICFLWLLFYLFEKNIAKESIFYKQPFPLRAILWRFKEIAVRVHRLPFLISGWECGHSTDFWVTIPASSHWGYFQHLLF